VVQYDEILAFHLDDFNFHLEIVLPQGGLLIAGWNLEYLYYLLQSRVVRSLREVSSAEEIEFDASPERQLQKRGDINPRTDCIIPISTVFSPHENVFGPPDSVPGYETLH